MTEREFQPLKIVKRRTIWSFRIVWVLWRLRVRLRYLLTGDCGCICGYVEPYGFVPEAECPIHDRYPQDEIEGAVRGGDEWGGPRATACED